MYELTAESTDLSIVSDYGAIENCRRPVCLLFETSEDTYDLTFTVFGNQLLGLVALNMRTRIRIDDAISELYQDEIIEL